MVSEAVAVSSPAAATPPHNLARDIRLALESWLKPFADKKMFVKDNLIIRNARNLYVGDNFHSFHRDTMLFHVHQCLWRHAMIPIQSL